MDAAAIAKAVNHDRVFGWLAAATAALASAWLFLAELVTAKLLLPRFGGAPPVWIVCLAFFQVVLVIGSLHADLLARWLAPATQVVVQAAVLAAALSLTPLSVSTAVGFGGTAAARLQVVVSLATLIGASFFAITGVGPLIAHWRAQCGAATNPPADAAYRLSVAANAGSAAVLLAYPFAIESLTGLSGQWLLVWLGFLVAASCSLACGWHASRRSTPLGPTARNTAGRCTMGDTAAWVFLAAVPASWLAGVTTHLTVEIAPIPLLWIVPLAAYLASFAIVFAPGGRRWKRREPAMLLTAIVIAATLLAGGFKHPAWLMLGLHLAAFFLASLALHGRLFDRRPPASGLTAFYLSMAVGGALGGLFNALLAPLLFDAPHEYPLSVLAAVFVAAFVAQESFDGVVHRSRSFFGVLRVCEDSNGPSRNLRHGGIIHGVQLVSDDRERRAITLSYYHPSGPLGSVFRGLDSRGGVTRVAVAGL